MSRIPEAEVKGDSLETPHAEGEQANVHAVQQEAF